MNEIIQSLYKNIEEHPEDWDLRLVLADAYEEIEELEKSEFWRKTALNKVRPHRNSVNSYNWLLKTPNLTELLSDVSPILWETMIKNNDVIFFPNQREAYQALFNAWKEAVKEGAFNQEKLR